MTPYLSLVGKGGQGTKGWLVTALCLFKHSEKYIFLQGMIIHMMPGKFYLFSPITNYLYNKMEKQLEISEEIGEEVVLSCSL